MIDDGGGAAGVFLNILICRAAEALVESKQEGVTHQPELQEQQWARTTRHCHQTRDVTGKR